MSIRAIAAMAFCSVALSSCAPIANNNIAKSTDTEQTTSSNPQDQQALDLFDTVFEQRVSLSPMWQTSLGRDTQKNLWDDYSEQGSLRWLNLSKAQLTHLQQLDRELLNTQNQISYQLLTDDLRNEVDDYQWRYHGYPINQMFGIHTRIPSLLMNEHRINNLKDAHDYIARLQGIDHLISQFVDTLNERKSQGIFAPKFVYPHILRDCENLLKGQPFEPNSNDDNDLLADFKRKLAAINIDQPTQAQLISNAKQALIQQVQPAYQKLMHQFKELEQHAPEAIGVWQQPNGDTYYQHRLERMTTTKLSAEEIHQLGLSEVKRVHQEMQKIIATLNFNGDLQDFFAHLRNAPKFTYPNTQDGKDRYLNETQALITNMQNALPSVFNLLPKADLIVKPVEPFREKSAGKAFYQSPAAEGGRPGIYYVNLYDMNNMPWYQMEALAYHEAVPGHHMQIAIAQELTGIPKFRRFGHYTAYIEGWGLYAELLPKEMGFYQDPYSDFGRLTWELWRSTRLVVDTGIHYKRWSKAQAIDYLLANTPNPKHDIERAVERYAVMPAQATTYKIGMIKILELREKAKLALGDKFDIRDFHDTILKNGALPLDILEQQVDAWMSRYSL